MYALAAAGQLAAYAAAALGTFAPRSVLGRTKVAALAAFFVMVNTASLDAAIGILRGRRIDRWDPQRAADAPVGGTDAGADADRDDDVEPEPPR
jgi:hypothetical protein